MDQPAAWAAAREAVRAPAEAAADAGELSDAEVLRRIAGGDPTPFDFLVDRYKHRLFSHIRRRINDPHRAEDLTQEVFLRLFRAARGRGYSPVQASVVTWLFTIANNCVIDHLRAESRRPAAPGPSTELASSTDPGAVAAEREGDLRMRRLLAQLPAEQREVIELHVLDGLSFGEVAELLGCPIPTAKSRLVYGLRKLKAALTESRRQES